MCPTIVISRVINPKSVKTGHFPVYIAIKYQPTKQLLTITGQYVNVFRLFAVMSARLKRKSNVGFFNVIWKRNALRYSMQVFLCWVQGKTDTSKDEHLEMIASECKRL